MCWHIWCFMCAASFVLMSIMRVEEQAGGSSSLLTGSWGSQISLLLSQLCVQ